MAAAHTFFVGNPEHMEMRQNLDYYQTMSGVKEADFKDLEAKPHMVKRHPSPSVCVCGGGFMWVPEEAGRE